MSTLPKKSRLFFSKYTSSKPSSSYPRPINSRGDPVLSTLSSTTKPFSEMPRAQVEGTPSLNTGNFHKYSDSLRNRSSYNQQERTSSSSGLSYKTENSFTRAPSQLVSREDRRELEDIFRLFDSNGDGKISVLELGSVLRALGESISERDLQLMIQEADEDGDGYVDLEEFVKLNVRGAGGRSLTGNQEELKDVFYMFDADKNGYISAEELHRLLRTLGDAIVTVGDCHQMIRKVDSDGDGFLNFEEFAKMMRMTVR